MEISENMSNTYNKLTISLKSDLLICSLYWYVAINRNYSAILATLQITSFALGV
jgi:hypothetical protein